MRIASFVSSRLGAIAVVCCFVATLAHEGFGHAGTTALLGGRVHQIPSTSGACDTAVGPRPRAAVEPAALSLRRTPLVVVGFVAALAHLPWLGPGLLRRR
ncbi:hypothetical protein J421_5748 (plasmid) [Gemmatirosa kalamazoonensis]|uniref:Uncharacterized protein n=1 Tax=Gemmatirosa kalamazoonensis TaxID=861299 RepID=W0RUN3_9BACT|nr:hypothetical protein [Gemmatirosa kalamazoonensis]AHG93283.1 hypothetical protein J421_5748 [Gemmatirosa kalamazoonensis]